MRWGVREESENDHLAVELCMQELKNCQKLSVGPNFVVSSLMFRSHLFSSCIIALHWETPNLQQVTGYITYIRPPYATGLNPSIVYVCGMFQSSVKSYITISFSICFLSGLQVSAQIVQWLEHCNTNLQGVGLNLAHICICGVFV